MARRVRRLVGRHEIVVVGYDGTETSRPALLWAAAEARRRAATLRGAAVLVLGRRGHGAHRSLVLGSVSARSVRMADVPVALMPPCPTDAAARGGRATLPNLAAVMPAPGGAGLILDR